MLRIHDDYSRQEPSHALADAVRVGSHQYDEATRAIYVLRADEVAGSLNDPRLWSRRPADPRLDSLPVAERAVQRRMKAFVARWPVFSDGDYHDRLRRELVVGLRGVVNPELDARLDARIGELLRPLTGRRFDWIDGFARPFAASGVMCTLGVSRPETGRVLALGATVLHELATPLIDTGRARAALAAADELRHWLADRIDPAGSPLLLALARIWHDEGLGPLAATAALAQIVTGGFDPVIAVLGVLAQRLTPAVRDTVAPFAIREELFRLASPFRFTARFARCPMTVGGDEVPGSARVVLGLATAGLDPARYEEPLRIVERPGNAGFAFGGGRHYCPGAPFARAMVGAVVRYFAEHRLAFDVAHVEREPELAMLRYRTLIGTLRSSHSTA